MSVGIFAAISLIVLASLSICTRPLGWSLASPEGNSTSDWKTKRSPTIRTSLRFPSASAEPAEELRTEIGELLNLAGERRVEAPGQVDDLDVLFLGLLLRYLESLFDARELLAQRGDLKIEDADLLPRFRRDGLLGAERFLGPARARSEIAQPDVPLVDFALGEAGPLLGRGKFRGKLLRPVAQRAQLPVAGL